MMDLLIQPKVIRKVLIVANPIGKTIKF